LNSEAGSDAADQKSESNKPSRLVRFAETINEKLREYCAKKKKETPQDKFSRRLANATVVIAVFTLVSVGVGALTYTAIKGQLNLMQGQLNEMKAASEQNAKLIVANEKLANATENAGRAWIAVTKFSFANLKDAADPLKTNIFYQNVGREPA